MVKAMVWVWLSLCVSVVAWPVAAQGDPTAPLSWQAPRSTPRATVARLPQLQSIICQGSSHPCYAILNGRTLAVGERIHGYTLSSIRDDEVTLVRQGRQWRLSLFAANVITE